MSTGEGRVGVSRPDLDAITQAALNLAYWKLGAQLQSSDNFDNKALGALAFDGAALAAILATRDVFHGAWYVPALLILISAGLATLVLQRARPDVGPDPRGFYDAAVAGGVPPGSAAKANVDLVSEFGGNDGSIARNEAILYRKGVLFGWALGMAIAAGIIGAILVAIA